MNTILSFASREIIETRNGFGSEEILIRTLVVPFIKANVKVRPDDQMPKTYQSKPLISLSGKLVYGELAILELLKADGWNGIWVDTYHGRGKKKVFWSGMPPEGSVTLPEKMGALYDKIVSFNGGKSSGFFDVFAWKNDQEIFLEYKGLGDKPNANEQRWIKAALNAGISQESLFFVAQDK